MVCMYVCDVWGGWSQSDDDDDFDYVYIGDFLPRSYGLCTS